MLIFFVERAIAETKTGTKEMHNNEENKLVVIRLKVNQKMSLSCRR